MDIQLLKFSNLLESHQADFMADGFVVSENINALPFPYYPSRTNGFVFCLCQQGYAELEINLVKYKISKDSVGIIIPDHIIRIVEMSDDLSIRFFALSQEFSDAMFISTRTDLALYFYVKDRPVLSLDHSVIEVINEYYEMFRQKGSIQDKSSRELVIQSLFMAMLYEISDVLQKQIQEDSKQKTRKEEIFEQFLKLVFLHFKEERVLAFYADRLYLTPKYLSSLCKSVTGKTAAEWIEDVVVLEAKALLKAPGMNVQMVSDQLNFPDQSFFGKYFKRLTGITPSEYKSL